MLTNRTTSRVRYGDTDRMGYAYYANYLRWFEIGRSELFRALGLTYREIEEKGIFLPVAEAYCRYLSPVRYDDPLVIETTLDTAVKGAMKFDYRLLGEDLLAVIAEGYTKHPCVTSEGRVVRPPKFIRDVIARHASGIG
ncbi:MAG: thioesterase family protein [Desulfobacterales bacterium]